MVSAWARRGQEASISLESARVTTEIAGKLSEDGLAMTTAAQARIIEWWTDLEIDAR